MNKLLAFLALLFIIFACRGQKTPSMIVSDDITFNETTKVIYTLAKNITPAKNKSIYEIYGLEHKFSSYLAFYVAPNYTFSITSSLNNSTSPATRVYQLDSAVITNNISNNSYRVVFDDDGIGEIFFTKEMVDIIKLKDFGNEISVLKKTYEDDYYLYGDNEFLVKNDYVFDGESLTDRKSSTVYSIHWSTNFGMKDVVIRTNGLDIIRLWNDNDHIALDFYKIIDAKINAYINNGFYLHTSKRYLVREKYNFDGVYLEDKNNNVKYSVYWSKNDGVKNQIMYLSSTILINIADYQDKNAAIEQYKKEYTVIGNFIIKNGFQYLPDIDILVDSNSVIYSINWIQEFGFTSKAIGFNGVDIIRKKDFVDEFSKIQAYYTSLPSYSVHDDYIVKAGWDYNETVDVITNNTDMRAYNAEWDQSFGYKGKIIFIPEASVLKRENFAHLWEKAIILYGNNFLSVNNGEYLVHKDYNFNGVGLDDADGNGFYIRWVNGYGFKDICLFNTYARIIKKSFFDNKPNEFAALQYYLNKNGCTENSLIFECYPQVGVIDNPHYLRDTKTLWDYYWINDVFGKIDNPSPDQYWYKEAVSNNIMETLYIEHELEGNYLFYGFYNTETKKVYSFIYADIESKVNIGGYGRIKAKINEVTNMEGAIIDGYIYIAFYLPKNGSMMLSTSFIDFPNAHEFKFINEFYD